MRGRRSRRFYGHRSCGYGGHHGRAPMSKDEMIENLESYQRDLEQEVEDVASRIRELKETSDRIEA